GEICVSNPGVFAGNTYTEAAKNRDLYAGEKYLRTGDLGGWTATAIFTSPAGPRI
ncbi:MAG: hypothetical protein RL128_1957, partial [Pseudomonadota bacterium]